MDNPLDNLDDINSVEDLLKAQEISKEYNELTKEEQEAVDTVGELVEKDWYIRVLIVRGLIGNLADTFKDIAMKIKDKDTKSAIGLLYDAAQMDVAHGIMRGVGESGEE